MLYQLSYTPKPAGGRRNGDRFVELSLRLSEPALMPERLAPHKGVRRKGRFL